ncbi:MAG TPA: DUF4215 domain-containing protein [Polyangiales bacterium]|nr:DUF4215 domain-containing protein [Polyangiales bacterium]
MLRGTRCDAHCEAGIITARVAGDGCCPSGAHKADDADCEGVCGNGMVEAGESCEVDGEPRCPDTCDDGDPCTDDAKSGSPERCDVRCTHRERAAGAADGCCPKGAYSSQDMDCPPACGNGMREAGETCDDGNLQSGDGCDAMCKSEITCQGLQDNLCELCTCTQCGARGGGCAGMFSADRVQKCLAVSACIRESKCSLVDCYCGTDVASCLSGNPKGPCRMQVEEAAGSDDVIWIVAQLREGGQLARALSQSTCESTTCAAVCAGR